MTQHSFPGKEINDPKATPADVADDRERTKESRKEQPMTGGRHDDSGHTPHVPKAD